MPSLENLHRNFQDQPFVLLGINVREDVDTVMKFVRSDGLTFTNLLDKDGMVSSQFGIMSTPTKVLIDPEGNLIGTALGYRKWDSEDVRMLVNRLISRKG